MATKTYYPLDAEIAGNTFSGEMQEDGAAPATAVAVTGWVVGTTGATNYSTVNIATERSNGTFSGTSGLDAASGPGGSINAWRIPTALTGTFADAAWDFDWAWIRDTAGANADGRCRVRIWKSVNADGTSSTELTVATLVGSTATNIGSTARQSDFTWSPGAIVLTGEYLFFALEWEITGAGSTASDDVHLRVGSTSRIVTPDFTLAGGQATTSRARVLAMTRRRRG